MLRRIRLLGPALAALVLLGADPPVTVERLLRQGNAAFERGDFPAALALYEQAEERATDPGQVAFNKATALYRLGLAEENAGARARTFRSAEDHYRRGAAGADEPRRCRALFGLGNSLLQARGEEAAALREAVRCYRACLADPDLAEHARHNLELAKLLWLKARERASRPDQENQNPKDGSNSSQNDPPMNDRDAGPDGSDPGAGQKFDRATGQPIQPGVGQQPVETTQRSPGQGDLPPVPDDEQAAPLTPREGEQHLEQAVDRILRDRRTHRLRSSRTPAGPVKDW